VRASHGRQGHHLCAVFQGLGAAVGVVGHRGCSAARGGSCANSRPVHPLPHGVATRHQVVATRHQVVATRHQVVATRHQVVATRHQVVAARHQVVATRHQVVATRHQVVATRHQVVVCLGWGPPPNIWRKPGSRLLERLQTCLGWLG